MQETLYIHLPMNREHKNSLTCKKSAYRKRNAKVKGQKAVCRGDKVRVVFPPIYCKKGGGGQSGEGMSPNVEAAKVALAK